MKVYPENKKNYKKHDLCVISIENQFLVSFSLDPALYYATPRHNPRSDLKKKIVLKWAQGLKKKSHEVSARKNNNRLRYNNKCRRGGGGFRPPGSFRVNAQKTFLKRVCDGTRVQSQIILHKNLLIYMHRNEVSFYFDFTLMFTPWHTNSHWLVRILSPWYRCIQQLVIHESVKSSRDLFNQVDIWKNVSVTGRHFMVLFT